MDCKQVYVLMDDMDSRSYASERQAVYGNLFLFLFLHLTLGDNDVSKCVHQLKHVSLWFCMLIPGEAFPMGGRRYMGIFPLHEEVTLWYFQHGQETDGSDRGITTMFKVNRVRRGICSGDISPFY